MVANLAVLAMTELQGWIAPSYAKSVSNASALAETFRAPRRHTCAMYQLTQRTVLAPENRLLWTLGIWYRRLKTRRGLRQLDARLLDDVGISEAERRRECAKRFWQA